MSFDAHKNFAYSTIATAPSPAASGTSLVVFAGDGTKFPAASFNATVWPANTQPTTANAEIVRVTVVSTDTFTITRAQESSSARTIIVGDQIAATITAKTLTDVEGSINPLTSPTIQTSIVTPASAGLFYGVCGGRLTLTTAVPVPVTDVTGATSVFFTPYGNGAGNIGLYDGSTNWTILPFVETTLALGTITSGLPYDVFAYNNSGVLALELLAWTSTSARATALVLQNGILSKTGALTRRYLGTFYTTATTTTEDSLANRYLWNYYNRVERDFLAQTATSGTYNYTSATWRQREGSATNNQVSCVVGVAEVAISLVNTSAASGTGDATVQIAIGEDSTSVALNAGVGGIARFGGATSTTILPLVYTLKKYPAVGKHTYAALEISTATGTTTWYAAVGTTAATSVAGLLGHILG